MLSSAKSKGYILANPYSENMENKLTADKDETIYDDNDLQNLVLNNFNLLFDGNYDESTKKIINNYGSLSLFSAANINYVFFLETDAPELDTVFNANVSNATNGNTLHKPIEIEICQNNCAIDLLYSQSSLELVKNF